MQLQFKCQPMQFKIKMYTLPFLATTAKEDRAIKHKFKKTMQNGFRGEESFNSIFSNSSHFG